MEHINIGLDPQSRNEVARMMNRTLADEFTLYVKTLNYHWNVFGMQFRELHQFFEEQYQTLAQVVDDVAERTRAIGGRSIGAMRTFLEQARIHEDPNTRFNGGEMVYQLLMDHEAIIRHLRQDIQKCDDLQDLSSSDFLTGLMGRHEKLAWMHRALLEG